MSCARPVRSVLLLCWRDTGHPQGGGSETYLQRIGSQLAADGVAVTLRTARYPGARRRRGRRRRRRSAAAAAATPCTSWRGSRWSRAGSGSDRCGACAPTSWSTPRTGCRSWPGWCSAAGPSCSCTTATAIMWPVAGLGAQSGRLVRRVDAVAAAAPQQPVRDGVAAVGARSRRTRGEHRPHRGGRATAWTRRPRTR